MLRLFSLLCVVLLGFAVNIAREFVIAYLYGTNHDIEYFRLVFAIPTAVVGLMSETYLAVMTPFLLRSSSTATSQSFNRLFNKSFTTISTLACIAASYIFMRSINIYETNVFLVDVVILSGFVCLTLLGLEFRAKLLVNNMKSFSAAYPATLNLTALVLLAIYTAISGTAPKPIFLSIIFLTAAVLVWAHYKYRDTDQPFSKTAHSLKLSNEERVVVTGMLTLVCYKIVNVVPRFIDRNLLSGYESGSVAAMEYSATLISLPVSYASILFVYLALPVLVRANFAKLQLASVIILIVAAGLLAQLLQQFVISPNLSAIMVRGEFDQNSLKMLHDLFDIHLYATVPLLLSITISTILIQMNGYKLVIICVFFKLAFKIFLVGIIAINRKEVAFTLVASEILLMTCLAMCLGYLILKSNSGAEVTS